MRRMAATGSASLYTRIPIPLKNYIEKYAHEYDISISEAVEDHLEASKGKVVRRGQELKRENDGETETTTQPSSG